jgi:hypothetical protein
LIARDYSDRFRDPLKIGVDTRLILSPERSLGSVIKLFTPSANDYTDKFNQWLSSIPQYLLELLFVVKRFYKPSWGANWREHFSVDIINGTPGNELKCDGRKLVSNFLRVGYDADGSWRVFGLRKDFHPAGQTANGGRHHRLGRRPAGALKHLNPEYSNPSVKFVTTPKAASSSARTRPFIAAMTTDGKGPLEPGNFLSNFQPLTARDARELVEDSIGFATYTEPMQRSYT